MTTKEQQYQSLCEALKELREDESITNSGAVSGDQGSLHTRDTVSLSGAALYNNTVIGGGYSVNTAVGLNYPNTISVSGATGITNPWATTASNTSAGKLTLNGENADIEINGVSLLEVLQDRLNMLVPNPTLEKEWDQLKELGDQYRKLEADLKAKAEMWDKLKKIDPPATY